MFRWHGQFSSCSQSLDDDDDDEPKTTKTDENIARVAAVPSWTSKGWLLVSWEKGEPVSQKRLLNVGNDREQRKLGVRFFPLFANYEPMTATCFSRQNVVKKRTKFFFKTIITNMENWCLVYDPESKRKNAQ